MKTCYLKASVIFGLLLMFCISVYCSNDENNQIMIDSILTEIQTKEAIIPDDISDDFLVKYGYTMLSFMYHDQEEREYVESMLVEEGTDGLPELYKWIGIKYIESGYQLAENKKMLDIMMEGKGAVKGDDGVFHVEADSDYHVGFGETLLIILLLCLAVIISVYKYIKRKKKKKI